MASSLLSTDNLLSITFLTLWGLFNIACYPVHKTETQSRTLFMTLILFAFELMTERMKFISILSLIISFLILIISGGIWFRFDCNNNVEIDSSFCLHSMLLPILFLFILSIDLFASFFFHQTNILILFIIFGLFSHAIIDYVDELEEEITSTQKYYKITGLLLTLASCVAFVVYGVKQSKKIAIFNIVITFFLYSISFQVYPSDDICSSTFIIWHMLIFYVAFNITKDVRSKHIKYD